MVYCAIDIAKYIVDYCVRKEKPISNLKLQKMLYYIWIEYYNSTKKMLFSDDMCAWQLGPVVPDVYYEFCSYAGIPITRPFQVSVEAADANVVNKAIEKYLPISASRLVDQTHKKGSPWDRIYMNGLGYRDIIPYPLIIS